MAVYLTQKIGHNFTENNKSLSAVCAGAIALILLSIGLSVSAPVLNRIKESNLKYRADQMISYIQNPHRSIGYHDSSVLIDPDRHRPERKHIQYEI